MTFFEDLIHNRDIANVMSYLKSEVSMKTPDTLKVDSTKVDSTKVDSTADSTKIPFVELQEAIIKISDFGKQIQASRLNRRCLEVLIRDTTGVSRRNISDILDAIPRLEQLYLKGNKIP